MGNVYQYTDLLWNKIRLVWLFPAASADAPLSCNIRIQDGAVPYEAISYTWGHEEEDDNIDKLEVLPTIHLRRCEQQIGTKFCDYHELIGDTYVHGLMEGDAIMEQSKLGNKCQQFELR